MANAASRARADPPPPAVLRVGPTALFHLQPSSPHARLIVRRSCTPHVLSRFVLGSPGFWIAGLLHARVDHLLVVRGPRACGDLPLALLVVETVADPELHG